MDAKVLYWTGALVNMGAIVGCVLVGVRQIASGNPGLHRRLMTVASFLVAGFVASYALKLHFVGREDLSTWSEAAVRTLQFHEACVATMLIGGGFSLFWGRRLRPTSSFSLDPRDEPADPRLIRRHRWAGRVAIGGAVLGFFSAMAVLAGMYARLPG